MGQASGFSFQERADGTVLITQHGRHAATLRAGRAAHFLDKIAAGEPQRIMARWTGDYKHGNERTARSHPRNR